MSGKPGVACTPIRSAAFCLTLLLLAASPAAAQLSGARDIPVVSMPLAAWVASRPHAFPDTLANFETPPDRITKFRALLQSLLARNWAAGRRTGKIDGLPARHDLRRWPHFRRRLGRQPDRSRSDRHHELHSTARLHCGSAARAVRTGNRRAGGQLPPRPLRARRHHRRRTSLREPELYRL